MKKSYRIDVDCAACAAKMENAAKKIDGVDSCIVNFMLQKMIVEFADGSDRDAVMANVVKECKKIESDAEIYLK